MPWPCKSQYPPLQAVSKAPKGDDDDGGGDEVGKDYGGKGDEENIIETIWVYKEIRITETIILKATMISGCDRPQISIAQDDWSRKKREDNDQERIDRSEEPTPMKTTIHLEMFNTDDTNRSATPTPFPTPNTLHEVSPANNSVGSKDIWLRIRFNHLTRDDLLTPKATRTLGTMFGHFLLRGSPCLTNT
ncbi:uncharacterized protein RAG0_11917 [Rhynchosporium agropyri]|uniref:Uncharacterized protein n=1 Tax=Rhynchosporium agropyri TaxID=914238 RepID=A0A1E1L6D7_9HELO|nr:uncharacterized protein RAG0_11917 [Rhynchosporium agropyri]